MSEFDSSDTKPTLINRNNFDRDPNNTNLTNKPNGPRETKNVKQHLQKNRFYLFFISGALFLFVLTIIIGAYVGLMAGQKARLNSDITQLGASLDEQFNLGIQNIEEGNLELARQRLEFVLLKDPSYPGATERLSEILFIIYATATPTLITSTDTAIPTEDTRPAEELFTQANQNYINQNWQAAIETLMSLRKINPSFEVARVDGMLYLALRYRGMEKIFKEHSLEGGIYDLALAEKFAPLDVDASNSRIWARLYIIGSSFWEVSPQQAVYYFGQVASAAPYLSDASGWTAIDRYRASLIQYGDLLFQQENWCLALDQYNTANSIRGDGTLLLKIEEVTLKCYPPTATPPTETITGSPTGSVTVSVTITGTINPTGVTSTITLTPTIVGPTSTIPSPTPSPTSTQPPVIPTNTPTPTQPIITVTPVPTDNPSNTPTP